MALTFDDGSTDLVNHGSDGSVDNLSAGTIMFWFKPTNNNGDLKSVMGQGDWGGDVGWVIHRGGFGGDILRMNIQRDVANQFVRSNAVFDTSWQFVAFTWSVAAGGPLVYRGTLTALASDVTDAGNTQDGAGAYKPDVGGDLIVGDVENAVDDYCYPMDFAWFGLCDTVLTLAQIQAQQFRPHVLADCVLWAHYGFSGALGTVADWSGNGNNGTPAGTALADHVPLGAPFPGLEVMPFPALAPPAVQTMPIISDAGIHSAVFHGLVIQG